MTSGSSELVTSVDLLADAQGAATYREFLRVPALSLGLFAPPAEHLDQQDPHRQDEVYVVISGEAVLVIAEARHPVSAGSIAYVPAGAPHRFAEVSSDLRVVVVFAPPEGDGQAASGRAGLDPHPPVDDAG